MSELFYWYKQPDEQETYPIEFADELDDDETISSETTTVIDDEDSDVTASILDSSSISGTQVLLVLKAGTDTEIYDISCEAVTSSGNTKEQDGTLEIVEK